MIFDISTPNGGRLSFEIWLKSDSSLICLISLKYVHFVHFLEISHFSLKSMIFDINTPNSRAPLKSD